MAELVTATISGFHAAGIPAAAKHFPGKGEATVEPHHELPLLALDLHRLPGSRPGGRRRGGSQGRCRLLLTTPDLAARERLRTGLDLAVSRGLLDQATSRASSGRVDALRRKVGNRPRPGREVVASAGHLRLATEVARQSVTLVSYHDHILPLRTDGRLLAVMPRPCDLTPADTSSTVPPLLGGALRRPHPDVVEITTEPVLTAADIAGVRGAPAEADSVVVGTISAGKEQARLVDEALASGTPTVTVALRAPFDLAAYPSAFTHLCTYPLLPPSMGALADVLFGKAGARGSLPAAIPGLHPRGHRWSS